MRAKEFSNSKLVIFDIDDTLVNTDTRVNVVKDGKVFKQLNSHDFTHYKLGPGEEFDFGAFKDAREFFTKAKPIPSMIKQLKKDIATGNKVIMVTARSDFNDRDIFLDTFRRFGIDMSKVHVYRAGNLAIKAATEEKKRIMIKHLLGKEHYDKIIMYDDSVPNLNAFLSLKLDYPWSKFYAWHVDPNGRADEYHRSDLKESIVNNVTDALPSTFIIPSLQNNDPYKQYRFGVAIAGSKGRPEEIEHEYAPQSAWGENTVIVSTDPDIEKHIDRALKAIGEKGKKRLSGPESKEPIDTKKDSILKPFKGYPR